MAETIGPETYHSNDDAQVDQTQRRGWRRFVRDFTPSWFSLNMGTGIVSILLRNFPYNADWLHYISYIFFALNVVLFVMFFLFAVLRYTLFPRQWLETIRHPVQSLYLGTFPMGLAAIINMIIYVCVPRWQEAWLTVAWVLWWLDAALAVICCTYLPFLIMTQAHDDAIGVTALWLLPVVSTIVASASGGLVADCLHDPQHSLITLLCSYCLWATGVPLAMTILVIYFHRLTTHSLPPASVAVSSFLPLGPLAHGGFAIMQLGKVAMRTLRETDTFPAATDAGQFLYMLGMFVGMLMWSFALVWLCFAIATVLYLKRFPYNIGWWSFVFPLGTVAMCTTNLSKELPSSFLRVLAAILSMLVVLSWVLVSYRTIHELCKGTAAVTTRSNEAEVKDPVSNNNAGTGQGSQA